MNDAAVNTLLAHLDTFAGKLGTTAGQIFDIYTQQARLAGWTDVGITVLLTLMITACGYVVYKDFHDEWSMDGFGAILGSALGIVLFIVLIDKVSAIPTEFLNPKFWALREIGELINGK